MKTIEFCRAFALGLLLLVLVPSSQGFVTRPDLRCWGHPADIVFVLDSSSSIWGPHFQRQLEFVKYMVDHMDIGLGPNQVRVGVETFSDYAHVHIDLSASTDTKSLKNKIDNIRQETGSTNIGDALRQLLSTMFTQRYGSRANVQHVAIVLTDGTSQDKKATQEAAQACRDENIQLFAIGIGHYVDYDELRGIASEPKSRYYFQTPSYNTLDQIRDDVIRQTCQAVTTIRPTTTIPTTPQRPPSDMEECRNKKADVFFLLDSSSSIEIEEYKKEINVIENIVTLFDISPNKTRVGVSVFGHDYYQMLSFDAGDNKAEAVKEIRKIKYVGGGTETGKALHQVRSDVFNQASIRPGAERILIVFTDGMSIDYARTSAEAKLLQESGVKIFVVGIGPDVDQKELRDLASKPSSDFVHTFDTFDILLKKSDLLTSKACTANNDKLSNDQDVCNATQRTDVVFMVSNNNFGEVKTNRILKASAEVIRRVSSSSSFRFGSIFDKCLPKQDVPVGSITEESKIVSFNTGSIASLVNKLRTETFANGSWDVHQVGLLFLDNTIDLTHPEIIQEVKRATFQNIELYAVIIGAGVNEQLVEKSIAPKDHIIKIYSYDDLISVLPSQFTKNVCKQSNSTSKPEIS